MNKFQYFICFAICLPAMWGCQKEKAKIENFGVVINELMPINKSWVADQNGEFDDWIELYNKMDSAVDLSGYYLSDKIRNPAKWRFPAGTVILADSFLIVWADNDTLQQGLHANFKLSELGETVIFLSPELEEIDRVTYPIVPLGQPSFARIPNGTGEFSWQTVPTFNGKNFQSP